MTNEAAKRLRDTLRHTIVTANERGAHFPFHADYADSLVDEALDTERRNERARIRSALTSYPWRLRDAIDAILADAEGEPTSQPAAMRLTGHIAEDGRMEEVPAAEGLDVPSMTTLTAILDDVPGSVVDSLAFDGEGLAAYIIGKWPEYARLAKPTEDA